MRIREIRCAGLRGATPEGGWDEELQADDCVHTLVLVVTEEGLTGLGSAFTSEALVKGALDLVWPLLRGEDALEPERVSDDETNALSENIARRFEEELRYPGQIKIVVIRETRAVGFAR